MGVEQVRHVLEEDEAEDGVLVLGCRNRAAQLVRRVPQGLLEFFVGRWLSSMCCVSRARSCRRFRGNQLWVLNASTSEGCVQRDSAHAEVLGDFGLGDLRV